MADSKLTDADRKVIDNVVVEVLRSLAHMARGNTDQNLKAHDLDYLADIVDGKVKAVTP